MSCDHLNALISELLDQRLDPPLRDEAVRHLDECRACRERCESLARIRSSLKAIAARPVPPRLAAQLQIAASRHRARAVSGGRWLAWARQAAAYAHLTMDNMMRPLALPFAGGLLSALVMFSSLVPSLAFHRDYRNDVPIMLFTDPALEEIGHSRPSDDDTVLELVVDDRGRVSDYAASYGRLTREMEYDLLFYRFAPATAFGQPTWGRVTVTFRRAGGGHIVVRG